MISIIKLTDGWLTKWDDSGGRFKEWIRDLELGAINHGWWYALSREPGRFVDKIKNIIRWIPVLWDDHDWDHAYLIRMMHAKIRNMRQYHEEAQFTGDWEETVKQLKIAEDCLYRLSEDDYNREAWDAYHKKWPEREWEKDKEGDFFTMAPLSDEQHKELTALFDEEERLRKQDLKTFADMFATHVRDWWD